MKKHKVFAISLLFTMASLNAQSNKDQIVAAIEKAFQAILSGDSISYYSTCPADYQLIDGPAGKELNREETWQMIKSFPPWKSMVEIVSMKVQGDVAWGICHYSFIPDEDGHFEKPVNFINHFEDYNHTSSMVLVRRTGKWEVVQLHFSNHQKE